MPLRRSCHAPSFGIADVLRVPRCGFCAATHGLRVGDRVDASIAWCTDAMRLAFHLLVLLTETCDFWDSLPPLYFVTY